MNDLEILLDACNKASNGNIVSKKRQRELVYARYVYFYYAKQLTRESLKRIGNKCFNRDHATVLHGVNQFNRLKGYPDFAEVHTRCVSEINRTKSFPVIELATKPKPIDEYKSKKGKVKEFISRAFLSNGISKDLMNLTESELNELITFKIKPHLQMLKSRKIQ